MEHPFALETFALYSRMKLNLERLIVEHFSLANIQTILNIDKSFNEILVFYEVLYKILRTTGKMKYP